MSLTAGPSPDEKLQGGTHGNYLDIQSVSGPILGLLCDMVDVNRSDASSDAHPGENRLIEKYESYAADRWPTNDFGVEQYIAQMSDREQELQAEDVLIHAAAQQTNHTITLQLLPPPVLDLRMIGDRAVLTWADTNYWLQLATDFDGVFTNIPGARSPYTNTIVGPVEFFRLMTNQ